MLCRELAKACVTEMSDQIRLRQGCLPWSPSEGAAPFRIYDEYDIPLLWIIVQDGCLYLFQCVAGQMTRPGVWIYTRIESHELADLDDASGRDFDALVAKIMSSRTVKIALSIRDHGIVGEVDSVELPSGIRSALAGLSAQLQRHVETLIQSRTEFGEIRDSETWDRITSGACQ
jgi:hypothetical protein